MIRPSLFVIHLVLLATFGSGLRAEVLIGLALPLTGSQSWSGGESEEAARLAIGDLNAAGGVLGQQVNTLLVDDHCEAGQAVAAARKLVESAVAVVVGHKCSSAAIPASAVYDAAGIPMISDFATNPQLTEQGFPKQFRVIGRDDAQGRIAGDLLVERWGDGKIAIAHDGDVYGTYLANTVKDRVHQLGVEEVVFRIAEPAAFDQHAFLGELQSLGIEVLYYGGYAPDAALIALAAQERGYDLQIVMGDAMAGEEFGIIAGAAGEGALFTLFPDPRNRPEAAALQGRISAGNVGGFTDYAAIQAWVQAVEKAGTFDADAVADTLHSERFDTVLGEIGFDEKGDVTGYDTFVWYAWEDGHYAPLALPAPTN